MAAACPSTRIGTGSRFTARYGVQRLVWYEEHFDIRDAIQREKSLKRWPRQWKIELAVWLRDIIGIIEDMIDFGHEIVLACGLVERVGESG